MKARKTLHTVMVCSFIIAACLQTQAKKADLPDDILSAKTITVRVKFVGDGTVTDKKTKRWGQPPRHHASADELRTYTDYARAEVEEVFTRKQRFQVVSDPSNADLVCLVIIYAPHLFDGRVSGAFYEVVMVMKGGTSTHWDGAPIWMTTDFDLARKNYKDNVAILHDQIEQTEKTKQRGTQ
ncbi:MAG TPA: hypothetical protein VGK01_26115 [Candidatus Angelobacter sp.]|jgi:hypothetical protein